MGIWSNFFGALARNLDADEQYDTELATFTAENADSEKVIRHLESKFSDTVKTEKKIHIAPPATIRKEKKKENKTKEAEDREIGE